MNFPILTTKELAKIAINHIQNHAVDDREFSFNMLSHGHDDFDINTLLDLLNSPSLEEVEKGLDIFNSSFVSIFGLGKHLDFWHIFDAQKLAVFAKSKMGDNASLFSEGFTTTNELEDGTLFVWCNEIMFIYKGDTYTVLGDSHYHRFTFFEGEPAYVVGKVSISAIEELIA